MNFAVRKTRTPITLLPFCLILLPMATRAGEAPKLPVPAVTFYVAPAGVDSGPGTKDRPFATLERARDEIRTLKKRTGLPTGGVAVLVRGGRYPVAGTFRLGQEDSGTERSPIVYRAYEGECPQFIGGVQLAGFQPVSDAALLGRLPDEARGKVVQVDLKVHKIAQFDPLRLGGFASGLGFKTHPAMELFFDGRAMPLSRWPNEGWVHVAGVSDDGHKIHGMSGSKSGRFTFEGDRPSRWKLDRDVLLYGYWFFDWADSYERVAQIDTDKRQITLEPPFHTYGYRAGQRYCAVNLLSEIDMPGEWYLDRSRGILYFYPPADPGRAVVEISTLRVPMVELQEVSHVFFQGMVWDLGCGDGVIVRGGEHCLLAGCTVRRFAGAGVEIQGGAGHGLLSCDVFSMGRGGVGVAGGDRKNLLPGGHFVENCHIYDISRIDHTYTPAVRMTGVGNRIAHNLVHDVRSSAINLGGNDHVVEFNEAYRVVWESDDQGGVDMFGNPTYRGNVYRYNYFHHIGQWRNPSQGLGCGQAGIRLDDAICGVTVHGNVFYRCSAGQAGFGGVQIHGGKDNVVDNNVFVECMAAISFSPWGQQRWKAYTAASLDSPEIQKSLYLARYPELARLAEDHDVNSVSRNLVVRCGEFLRRSNGRAQLQDNVVAGADPGFADAARGNFRLDGPASARPAGFKPIPFDQIGLYRDEYRKELPSKTIEEARSGKLSP